MLIKCIECNHDVSEFAENCPNCGCPIEMIKTVEVSDVQKITCDDPNFEIEETVLRKYTGKASRVVIPYGITRIEDKAFYDDHTNRTWDGEIIEEYNTDMEEVLIPDTVTTIGMMAFKNCVKLKEVNIPNSVLHIEEDSFFNCVSLASITMSDNIITVGKDAFSKTAWYEEHKFNSTVILGSVLYKINTSFLLSLNGIRCIADYARNCDITLLSLPEGLVSIGSYAFCGCSELTEVVIPNSVMHIGNNAFSGCCKLSSIHISSNLKDIEGDAFGGTAWIERFPKGIVAINDVAIGYNGDFPVDGKLFIPEGVVGIGSKAFQDKHEIKEIVTSTNLEIIGDSAFKGCYNLQKVQLNRGLKTIEKDAFKFCKNLNEIYLPDGLLSIGECAFGGHYGNCNNKLTEVSIPRSVEYIGKNVFGYCNRLEKINISKEQLGKFSSSFDIHSISFSTGTDKTSLIINKNIVIGYTKDFPDNANMVIPEGITVIEENAFRGCSGLKTIEIPCSVKHIGKAAFYGCNNLINVTIPESVISIGKEAFANCDNLAYVDIPNSITKIEEGTFVNCVNLDSVTLPNSITYLGDYSFAGCRRLVNINIPKNLTTIADTAFAECSLENGIVIPENITAIHHCAFRNTSLKRILLHKNILLLEGAPFVGCEELEEVVFLNDSVEIRDGQHRGEYYEDCGVFGELNYWHEINVYLPKDSQNSEYFEKLSHVNVYYFDSIEFKENGEYKIILCEQQNTSNEYYEDEIFDYDPRDFYDPDDFI